jgi:hypothetical protein
LRNNPHTNEESGTFVNKQFWNIFRTEALTLNELEIWSRIEDGKGSKEDLAALPALLAILDKAILIASEDLGIQVVMSPVIYRRLSTWTNEPHGPLLFAELGRALGRFAETMQGIRKARRDGAVEHRGKLAMIQELRIVAGKLRDAYLALAQRPRRSNSINNWLIGEFTAIVGSGSDGLPLLRDNLSKWVEFLRSESEAFEILVDVPRRVPSLYDRWNAFNTPWDVEKLRQHISAIGNRDRT